MRKLFYLVVSIVIFGLIISGCFFHVVPPLGQDGSIDIVKDGVSYKTNLIAGQHTVAGSVTVSNDGENLFVTYETSEGWLMNVTHLYVDTIAPTKSAPGKFPYKHEKLGGVTTDTYEIPLIDLGVAPCDTIYIAAHAELVKGETEETGWAEGVKIRPGKNWAMYFNYQIWPCETQEIEYILAASAKIDLETGGVVEVTDESSEIYGTRVIIEPIDKGGKSKSDPVVFTIFMANIFTGIWTIGEYQGFLVSPVVVKSGMDMYAGIVPPDITVTLELPYNEDKLSNAGVSKNETPNLYRINSYAHFEKVPEDEYTCNNNKIIIEINPGEEGYFSCHALTVTNCEPPTDLGTPLPGDLVYRLSCRGQNDNWLPGHVGIYVGTRYDKDNGVYNVIEAIGKFYSIKPLDIGGEVEANYYESLTDFNLNGQASYMGARQPLYSLSHTGRKNIIKFAEDQIGKEYAFRDSFWFCAGLANGNRVKGPDSYNCVGLAEAAYQSVGIDIVSDDDEGNNFDTPGPDLPNPDAILTPPEQFYRTVPASGILQNTAPAIRWLEMVPENPNTGDSVSVICHASDHDKDDLFYEWTIKDGSGNIIDDFDKLTRGNQIDFQIPSIASNYNIKCRAFDNYGGEAIIYYEGGLESYTITASAGSHGSISPSGDIPVNEGSNQSFTITPDSGYQIADVKVNGNSVGAVSSYTFINVTEDHTIMATFIKEDQYYTANAHSAHFADGYYVELMINDPNQTVQSVTVSGPEIVGSISLAKGIHPFNPNQWWSNPNVSLGDNPPDLPLVYTFTIIDKMGITYNINDSVQSYVVDFATNLLPQGTQTNGDGLVFSWTGVEIEGVKYIVQLHDENWNRIWDSPIITDTSFTYNGPVLASGDYKYFVSVNDVYGNESLADQNFQIKAPQTELVQGGTAIPWTDNSNSGINYLINVFWNVYEGADGYKVYRQVNNTNDWQMVFQGEGDISGELGEKREWHDQNVQLGNTYEYYVVAYGDGWETEPNFETGPLSQFLPPIYLDSPADKTTVTDSTPTLQWSPLGGIPNGFNGPGKTELEFYDADTHELIWHVWFNDVTTSSVTFNQDGQATTSLVPGHTYGWKVRNFAFDQNLEDVIAQSEYWEFTYNTFSSIPIVHYFVINPSTIVEGDSAILSWQVTEATHITISPDIGSVDSSGSVTIYPSATTTYTLTATNSAGSCTSTRTIEVGTSSNISATINSYSPASKITINTGQSFIISTTFTNTGNTSAYFYPGVSIWNSSGSLVYDGWGSKKYLSKNQQGTASWSPTINTAGEYWLQFGIWDEAKSELFDKKPSPSQNLIKVVESPTTLSFTNLTPSQISTSTSPYQATLSATGSNFNNVNRISFSWYGAASDSATWYKGDTNWNNKVTINSDNSMTLKPGVIETNPAWSGTAYWTVTLRDDTGKTASKSFTVTYTPLTPQVTGVDPSQPTANPSRQYINILGNNFASNAQVTLQIISSVYPIPENRTQFIDSTRIKVYVGLTDSGNWKVWITNPNGQKSNEYSFYVKP